MAQKLIARNVNTGEIVNVGDTITCFRGETWTLVSLDRAAEPGRSGKVTARQGDWSHSYYDKVFDLVVEEA